MRIYIANFYNIANCTTNFTTQWVKYDIFNYIFLIWYDLIVLIFSSRNLVTSSMSKEIDMKVCYTIYCVR